MSESKVVLLVVDDDESIRSQMKWALSSDYEVILAEDRGGAIQQVKESHPSVVCLDLGLPPHPSDAREGLAALEDILRVDPSTKVVVITGQGEKENAIEAVNCGAYDFFSKPIEIDVLKVVLSRARYLFELELENRNLRSQEEAGPFQGMLGTSRAMQEVFSTIRKVATSDAPVVVSGESGTGKELAARAIHSLSRRKEGPFIPINCGAIPENLLESELFGHEKGAFTGAHVQKPGQLEAAQNGTLFLDEVGELSLPLQVKLLRFLQDGQIQRVGGRGTIEVDARVIAATNVNLEDAIQEKRFREDLYYRLAVVLLDLPPLRQRDEDLELLANEFLKRYVQESNRKISGFTAEVAQAIRNYSWPGNVRELENRLRRAAIMADGNRITLADLGLDASYAKYSSLSLKEARELLEKEMVERALARCAGNISKAADELGVSRPTLYELIEKLNIER
jgi:two-component system NtrC family response regulator